MVLVVFLHLLIYENLSDLLEEKGRTKFDQLLPKEAVQNSISLIIVQLVKRFQVYTNQEYH